MTPCNICGTDHQLTFIWETPLVRCPTCGLCYWEPQPTFEEIEAIYNESDYFTGDSYVNYVGEKAMIQANFEDRLQILHELRPPSGDLLEIGSAYGFFLELVRPLYDHVAGIELSSDAAAYAQNTLQLDVQIGDLESHPPAPLSYDVVAMWDTIEHLYNPYQAVKACVEALRPGGLLALNHR